jgi:hypothetical protein
VTAIVDHDGEGSIVLATILAKAGHVMNAAAKATTIAAKLRRAACLWGG